MSASIDCVEFTRGHVKMNAEDRKDRIMQIDIPYVWLLLVLNRMADPMVDGGSVGAEPW